ncbi:hypothetical protein GIB67_005154 [Kingdonia uniflora]|uniref:ENTH domain-containing protein n=1 Tax=Kingdonia uniflora TaxID=39325 RepID=A0A7J7NNL9_9MAGN|nr:hypothetical protein GIB67_005154 [Kingdonia uniflora]
MQRRFKQAYTALKEHGWVNIAKIATIGGYCDLDLIVIKATAPDDLPLSEKYIHELLKVFSFSPSSFRAFSLSFTKRFGRTQCWRVALKCLILLHRLLRSLPENSPFRSDLLWSRSNGLISLYPCRFRDNSSSRSKDFTGFIRAYAHLLDEALDCFSIESDTSTNENSEFSDRTFTEKMKEVRRVLNVLPQLQSLLDKFIECSPVGFAAKSLLVKSAMKQIVRDSFVCYGAFRHDIMILLDNLFQMQHRNCISAFSIYKRAAIQASDLTEFYETWKEMGLCGFYEYPFVDKIPYIHVQALESFLNGMWQLTDSSSSETSTSSMSPPSTLTEDESDKRLMCVETVMSTKWEKFEDEDVDNDEEKPLIQFEIEDDNNNVCWEDILEASIMKPHILHDNQLLYSTGYNGYGYECCNYAAYTHEENKKEDWKMQVYNPF